MVARGQERGDGVYVPVHQVPRVESIVARYEDVFKLESLSRWCDTRALVYSSPCALHVLLTALALLTLSALQHR